ncbi:helix-turn-helix domain-containing protein [Staphylococcus gallinarum]|uniref:helix-turn-helix transcriptional regulator n=1 Tax=Staphylococcus gallinarum TaxID=1293 RepID=UPI001E45B3D6|nr:helix-turn-helix domain-containing protein [Staphylococcus gallinarum]MCD8899431.1 helix-turn-helix domain-containing protein [Staphylococcus gallinarum]
MINKVAGYRKMLGLSQIELATKMKISAQAYSQKENGNVPFKDAEKVLFKNMLLPYFPSITIDEIFFDNKLSKVD